MDLSVALLSVGYIVGIRIASFIFFGGVLGFGLLVPMYGLIYGWPVEGSLVDGFYTIWSTQGGMLVLAPWSSVASTPCGACARPSSQGSPRLL